MKHYIIVVIFVAICSCSPSGNHQDTRRNTNECASRYILFDRDTSENFNSFISKISTDSIFQRSRIKFPITIREVNAEDSGHQVSALEPESWFFVDFRQTHGLEREVFEKGDSEVIIRYYDPEIAFEVIYIFRCSLGKWYLEEIVDNSN